MNLTVLYHEGPMGRAYLAALQRSGIESVRIIRLVSPTDPANGKRVASWMPAKIRLAMATQVQAHRRNFWSREIRRHHP